METLRATDMVSIPGNVGMSCMSTWTLEQQISFWVAGKSSVYAGFSVAGPDLLALAAGEITNPRRQIPRVAKRSFYRIADLI